VRWAASGVRSSCEAFATKWRCDFERGLKSLEEAIERFAEIGQFVVRAAKTEAPVKVGCRDLASSDRHGAKWLKESSGEPPRAGQRNDPDGQPNGRGPKSK